MIKSIDSLPKRVSYSLPRSVKSLWVMVSNSIISQLDGWFSLSTCLDLESPQKWSGTPLGVSVKDFPERINWSRNTEPKCEWHQPKSKKEKKKSQWCFVFAMKWTAPLHCNPSTSIKFWPNKCGHKTMDWALGNHKPKQTSLSLTIKHFGHSNEK